LVWRWKRLIIGACPAPQAFKRQGFAGQLPGLRATASLKIASNPVLSEVFHGS